MVSPVIVALDVPTLEEATVLARSLAADVGGFKVGMELLMGEGPRAITTIAEIGLPVFADAKLHDIPNTVGRAAARIRSAGARWVTVHGAGGSEMVESAVEAMGERGVLAVTMLTSLAPSDLPRIGIGAASTDYVTTIAALAAGAGCEGVVCSPKEIATVRGAQPGLHIFTPGVRPETAEAGDQRRTGTPERAIADGAHHLVIGRPITEAPDPVLAAREIGAAIGAVDSPAGAMVESSRPQT
jgi:orotidine-5'-phosphate decarboxylase